MCHHTALGWLTHSSHSWMSEATVSYCILQDFYKHEFVNFANRAWLQLLDYTLVLYMYYRYTVCLHLCALYHTKPSLTVVYSKESHPVITSWTMPWSLMGHARSLMGYGSASTSLTSHSLCKTHPLFDWEKGSTVVHWLLKFRSCILHCVQLMNSTITLIQVHGSVRDHIITCIWSFAKVNWQGASAAVRTSGVPQLQCSVYCPPTPCLFWLIH